MALNRSDVVSWIEPNKAGDLGIPDLALPGRVITVAGSPAYAAGAGLTMDGVNDNFSFAIGNLRTIAGGASPTGFTIMQVFRFQATNALKYFHDLYNAAYTFEVAYVNASPSGTIGIAQTFTLTGVVSPRTKTVGEGAAYILPTAFPSTAVYGLIRRWNPAGNRPLSVGLAKLGGTTGQFATTVGAINTSSTDTPVNVSSTAYVGSRQSGGATFCQHDLMRFITINRFVDDSEIDALFAGAVFPTFDDLFGDDGASLRKKSMLLGLLGRRTRGGDA